MASSFDLDPPPDSSGRRKNTDNAHECMDKATGPLYHSRCRPGRGIVPECEVFFDGEGDDTQLKLQDCQKNPGHENFISVKDFTMEHLPEQMRTEEVMWEVRDSIARTVLIRVTYTSFNRPDTFHGINAPYPHSDIRGKPYARCGTGLISSLVRSEPEIGDCPCGLCRKSGNPKDKFWKYRVATAAHVVFDDEEARRSVIKCFYDCDEDFGNVVKLHGVKMESVQSQDEMYGSDLCENLVCVTHDKKSVEEIESRIARDRSIFFNELGKTHGIIVSHPHGCSKMISLGKFHYSTISIKPGYEIGKREQFPKDAICYVIPYNSSGKEVVRHHLHVSTFRKYLSRLRGLFKSRKEYHHTGATFTLPDDAEYYMKYHYDKEGFTFPRGTKFNSGNGLIIPIPDDTLFESKGLTYGVLDQSRSLAYDVPTCPGSSGANVVRRWSDSYLMVYTCTPHSGWDKEGQLNRSCFTNDAIETRFQDELFKSLEESADS